MALATTLGFPRIGLRRELKAAVETYWQGELSRRGLDEAGAGIRRANWLAQKEAGIDLIPSNDFSLYDHVLDTCVMVGAVPGRFLRGEAEGGSDGEVDLDTYFAMARGREGTPAMELTKWFDTNYHYLVPEIGVDQSFRLASTKPVDEFREALALGIRTKPVLLGPVSFLLLAKTPGEAERRPAGAAKRRPAGAGAGALHALDRLLPVYEAVLAELARAGACWVQINEPCLALDRTNEELDAYRRAFGRLRAASGSLKLFLATYFDGLDENLPAALALPVDAVHLDLVRAPESLDAALELGLPEDKILSLGVIDGRNVWRNDLSRSLALLRRAARVLGSERIMVAPSCSLVHVPIDLRLEDGLDEELKSWLAFAVQKLDEVRILTRAINEGKEAVAAELRSSDAAQERRRMSSRTVNPRVRARLAAIREEDFSRNGTAVGRRSAQRARLDLPLLPTTTIGSFPQTPEVRKVRARFRKGEIGREQYEAFLRDEIRSVIALQEELGLDVLVHGEFERTDMVEYFAEQLSGFAVTAHGWVQSYGTRCVKPPILYGDVERPHPMTVEWARYAASLTDKPVKGMLTGPVTILKWSFVRDDQPPQETCRQIALAIRDEVRDLEAAGIGLIQIDEAALREGAPLRAGEREAYFGWAVECFRLATAGVRETTQVHTHMCYSEFNDMIPHIAAMDADVISIEASRSGMELLGAFGEHALSCDIGPGVYDIHSPRIPPPEEIEELIERSLKVLRADQLWINPDCGLKTRRLDEVAPSLRAMVTAARRVRERLKLTLV